MAEKKKVPVQDVTEAKQVKTPDVPKTRWDILNATGETHFDK